MNRPLISAREAVNVKMLPRGKDEFETPFASLLEKMVKNQTACNDLLCEITKTLDRIEKGVIRKWWQKLF